MGYFKGTEGMKIGSLGSNTAEVDGEGVEKQPSQSKEVKEYFLILVKAHADQSGMTKEGTGKPGKELSGAFSDVIKMLRSVKYLENEEDGNMTFIE